MNDSLISKIINENGQLNIKLKIQGINNQDNIRNICEIEHVDHGRQTIIDQLLNTSGINLIDQSKEVLIINKNTKFSLQQQQLFNLIDCPRLLNLVSEAISSSLRVSDGFQIVVDYLDGTVYSTESILRMAVQEKVKPVLMVNKLDRAIQEIQQDSETIQTIQHYLHTNQMIWQGTVAFGSGKNGWSSTCIKFAELYDTQFNTESKKLQDKILGENYLDTETNSWIKDSHKNNSKEF
ncbi:unnamed protein product [Paramecium octaurelia]|uniref:Tr-type G domain-containing protein n=1 Tax=Paramecium octaurelia TaxID=43137 RepID=A0A8S1YRS9_PAROT|nr:unnamed protein product [Paramecium octaurelia]